LDVFVSKDSLDRALGLAQSLFLSLENAGHRVTFAAMGSLARPAVDERLDGGRDPDGYGSWSPDRPTVAYLGSVVVGLTIFKLSQEVEMRYVDGKYVRVSQLPPSARIDRLSQSIWSTRRHMPMGKLCIRASSPYAGVVWDKQWREAKRGDLKGRLPEIVSELEACAPRLVALVEEHKRQVAIQLREWEVQQEKWRIEAEQRQRAQSIKDSREQLFSIIEAWAVAIRTEAFFKDIEERGLKLADNDLQALLARLQIARSLLGEVDALHAFAAWRLPEER
jgi:hypothetical protein